MSTTIVAFQGEHGANSEEAIRQHFDFEQIETLPCETLGDLFLALHSGKATHGMLPVENALGGTVAQSYELLMEYDFRVQGEYILPVHHQLMAPPGTTLEDIQHVKSHPQALAQCTHYLRRHGFEPVATYDTAGAARQLAETPEPNTAALASSLAAKLYGLTILDSNVEDEAHNSTRFFILGMDDAPIQEGRKFKTSLVFTFRDRAGALYECLGAFAKQEINLTKIESRPLRARPWQYWFFVDLEGHWQEPKVEAALVELLRKATFVKVLGSYPVASGRSE